MKINASSSTVTFLLLALYLLVVTNGKLNHYKLEVIGDNFWQGFLGRLLGGAADDDQTGPDTTTNILRNSEHKQHHETSSHRSHRLKEAATSDDKKETVEIGRLIPLKSNQSATLTSTDQPEISPDPQDFPIKFAEVEAPKKEETIAFINNDKSKIFSFSEYKYQH